MTDGHYAGYQEMLAKVQWEKYGVVNGVARDPRCEHCMVHCGYDPSGALGTNYQRGDNWKNFKYNFGAKPKPFQSSPELEKRAYQRRFHRQRPSGRGEGRHQFARRRRARRVLTQGRTTRVALSARSAAATATRRERDDLLAKIKDVQNGIESNLASNEQDTLSFTAVV